MRTIFFTDSSGPITGSLAFRVARSDIRSDCIIDIRKSIGLSLFAPILSGHIEIEAQTLFDQLLISKKN